MPGDAGAPRGNGTGLAARPVRGDARLPARPRAQARLGDGAVDPRPRPARRAARAGGDGTVRARPRPARTAHSGGVARRRRTRPSAGCSRTPTRTCCASGRRRASRSRPTCPPSPPTASASAAPTATPPTAPASRPPRWSRTAGARWRAAAAATRAARRPRCGRCSTTSTCGCVLTLDALHACADTGRAIVDIHGADHMFDVKANCPETFALLETIDWDAPAVRRHADGPAKGHGRAETRSIAARDLLPGAPASFAHARQAFRVIRERTVVKTGATSTETACGITSVDAGRAGPDRLPAWNRGHWQAGTATTTAATPPSARTPAASAPATGPRQRHSQQHRARRRLPPRLPPRARGEPPLHDAAPRRPRRHPRSRLSAFGARNPPNPPPRGAAPRPAARPAWPNSAPTARARRRTRTKPSTALPSPACLRLPPPPRVPPSATVASMKSSWLAERHGLSKRQIRRIMAAARGEEERPCTAS